MNNYDLFPPIFRGYLQHVSDSIRNSSAYVLFRLTLIPLHHQIRWSGIQPSSIRLSNNLITFKKRYCPRSCVCLRKMVLHPICKSSAAARSASRKPQRTRWQALSRDRVHNCTCPSTQIYRAKTAEDRSIQGINEQTRLESLSQRNLGVSQRDRKKTQAYSLCKVCMINTCGSSWTCTTGIRIDLDRRRRQSLVRGTFVILGTKDNGICLRQNWDSYKDLQNCSEEKVGLCRKKVPENGARIKAYSGIFIRIACLLPKTISQDVAFPTTAEKVHVVGFEDRVYGVVSRKKTTHPELS